MKKIKVNKEQYARILLAYRLIGFFFVLLVLIGYSILINKVLEFILIFLPYFVTKGFYSKQYHSNSLKECLLISILIFSFLVTISLDINSSIIFSCVLGLVIALLSYYAGDIQFKLKDYNYIEPRYNELVEFYDKYNSFGLKSCTKDELIERCRKFGLNNEQIDFCVKAFIDKIPEIELADYCGIELQSVKNKKQYYKKKLMN